MTYPIIARWPLVTSVQLQSMEFDPVNGATFRFVMDTECPVCGVKKKSTTVTYAERDDPTRITFPLRVAWSCTANDCDTRRTVLVTIPLIATVGT